MLIVQLSATAIIDGYNKVLSMNWFTKISQQDHPMRQIAESFPVITQWNGMELRSVDNIGSIDSSMMDYEILNGIRELPISIFDNLQISARNQKERDYLEYLSNEIQQNKSIEPLIIVFDNEQSPYVLEGNHRIDVLVHYLKATTVPSLIVLDWDDIEQVNSSQDIVSFSREKIKRVGQQNVRYEWVDSDINDLDDIGEQAYDLALNSPVNVLSDKELSVVAISGEQVVGALFTSIFNNSYSFDVVVDPKFQQQGIGGHLTDLAISEYKNMSADMPELQMDIDTVNPVMQNMLQNRGLSEKEKISDQRSIMGKQLNWYNLIKTSQNYDDIRYEDYENTEEFEANQYFAIGHDNQYGEEYEDRDGNFAIWIWEGPGLLTKSDKGTHGTLPGGHDRSGRVYKGRVDFRQKIISVVPPKKPGEANLKFDINDLPNSLLRDLQKSFPEAYERIIVF